jgi:hypothetical protein
MTCFGARTNYLSTISNRRSQQRADTLEGDLHGCAVFVVVPSHRCSMRKHWNPRHPTLCSMS